MHIKSILAGSISLILAALPVSASAHGSMKPSHGGMVTLSGEIMVELVQLPTGIEVYVTEEDAPVPAAALDAKLIVTAAGTKTDTALVPDSGNKLVASALKVPSGAKVVVALADKRDGAKTFATFSMK